MRRYAVILAGGRGERLWPKSRKAMPKHLQAIVGARTMIQQTVDRLDGLVPPERIYVVTAEAQRAQVSEQLPQIDPANVFGEPVGRNTAPAIALAAAALSKRDPESTMISLHADAAIGTKTLDVYRRTLADCCTAAEQTRGLVTIGIVPTHAATGYGYIHRAERVSTNGQTEIYSVERFVEKPDQQTARGYVAQGGYYWNSGIFVWTVEAICKAFERHMPELHRGLVEMRDAIDTPRQDETVRCVYERLKPKPIDTGVMEREDNVYTAAGTFLWDDVGSWASLANHVEADVCGNVVVGPFEYVDTKNCIISGDGTLVTAIGVEGLVIVKTTDALLVCARSRVEEVKDLVGKLKAQDDLKRYL
ncbi:MAG: mannose-1-phosphate guanylyltransferase [Verrucomicrobia bacterium]|nr:mannose-1-phosphate guanylyltransferase [Verrucomicrobiota bacterium]